VSQPAEFSNRPLDTPRKSVARNTLWNFGGQLFPLALAAVAIPVLVHHLGVDRFGVLTLVWILVGYFSLFDLGIGRAVTKLLAERIALRDAEGAANLIWTAIACMVLLGIGFGLVLFALAPWLTQSVLKIPPALQREILRSLPWLAAAVPFVTLTCGLRGMLEAQQNFAAVNALRAVFGFVSYLGPLFVVPFSHSLYPVVLTLAAARIVSCGLHFWVCTRCVTGFSLHLTWDRSAFRALLGFGSWLTVSNIVGPLMVYLDRFVIGSLISISAVAYYAAPFDAVTKLWLIPAALSGVLFPAFSEALAVDDRGRATSLYERSIASTFAILFPVVLGIVLFAHEGLHIWLGQEFANRSAVILQVLAIGVFTNSLANMPYALLQASGRPDLTAKIHLVEVPCYMALLYWGIRLRGIEGAALAWTLRLTVEAVVLFLFVRKLLAPRLWATMGAGAATLVIACGITGLVLKTLFLAAMVALFSIVIWRWTLDAPFRLRMRSWLRAMPMMRKVNACL
jgi:O-antigen/teichoic acid export membrane protein